MNMTPDQRNAIIAALKSGNKIEAIKLCREATGLRSEEHTSNSSHSRRSRMPSSA